MRNALLALSVPRAGAPVRVVLSESIADPAIQIALAANHARGEKPPRIKLLQVAAIHVGLASLDSRKVSAPCVRQAFLVMRAVSRDVSRVLSES